MPKVGKKKYPYTAKGKAAAAKARAKKAGKKKRNKAVKPSKKAQPLTARTYRENRAKRKSGKRKA